MVHAWDKGVSPYEYRKCLSKDLKMISAIQNAKAEKAKMKRQSQDLMKEIQNR